MTGYIDRFLKEFPDVPGRSAERTEKTRPAPGSLGSLGIAGEESSKSTPPSPVPPRRLEQTRPAGPDGWGPPPADRGWRKALAGWPVEWRERWGRRANELQDAGASWAEAEWRAFHEVARDLVEAERRGEVPESSYPDPAAHDGLSDEEAVAAIDLAFGEGVPAPARRSDRGPRDVRRGDKWLPWHFRDGERGRARRATDT
jgi:hypothetical protein